MNWSAGSVSLELRGLTWKPECAVCALARAKYMHIDSELLRAPGVCKSKCYPPMLKKCRGGRKRNPIAWVFIALVGSMQGLKMRHTEVPRSGQLYSEDQAIYPLRVKKNHMNNCVQPRGQAICGIWIKTAEINSVLSVLSTIPWKKGTVPGTFKFKAHSKNN